MSEEKNMNTIVIYNSKTGFPQKYAEWIAAALDCEAIPQKNAKALSKYDLIIFGGGIMASMITGLSKMKKSAFKENKKLVVFATGATHVNEAETIEGFKNANFTENERQSIPFFYFQSGLNFEKMKFFPKALLNMMKNSLAKKENKTEEEKEMLKAFEHSCDSSSEKFIAPLVEYVKKL